MNRREFITAVGAVPVATYLARFPIAEVVQRWQPRFYEPWQMLIWDKLQQGKDVIYATGNYLKAQDVYNLFGRHKKLHCNSMGGALMGRRADFIILDDFATARSDTEQAAFDDWYNCALRTRLAPGAEPIKWIHT